VTSPFRHGSPTLSGSCAPSEVEDDGLHERLALIVIAGVNIKAGVNINAANSVILYAGDWPKHPIPSSSSTSSRSEECRGSMPERR
jgi:hypothetical protein